MGMGSDSGGNAPGASWIRRRALTATAAVASLLTVGAVMGPAAQAAPAPAGDPQSSQLSSQQGDYVVRAAAGHLSTVSRELKAKHLTVTRTLNIINALVAKLPAGGAASVARLPYVVAVTPDATVTPLSAGLMSLSASYDPTKDASSAAAIAHTIGVDTAWKSNVRGAGTAVALIDTGVTKVDALAGSSITNGPDISFDSQSATARYADLNGHGTLMAGLIGAKPSGTSNYQGMAPDTKIVNIKAGDALGRVDVSQVIAGIDWAVQHKDELGIRVINLSFGTDSKQSYVLDPLAYAAEVAWNKGIVVVTSAGNGGGNNLTDPAIDPYVIAVGALDGLGTISTGDDVRASFSAQGGGSRKVDLVVPAVKVQGLRVPGSYISDWLGIGGINQQYLRGSGTSEAAALVSGLVADLLSARPTLTPNQVKKLLVSTGKVVKNTQGVLPNLGNALAATAPSVAASAQTATKSTGTGSLEASRGGYHVIGGLAVLSGEVDIFGNPISTSSLATAEAKGTSWSGGTWNGASWAGASWAGASWAGASWAGASWAGASWAGASWAGASWTGASWAGASWAGASWAGASWAGAGWAGAGWAGAGWAGGNYS